MSRDVAKLGFSELGDAACAVCHGYLTIPIPHPKGLLGRVQTTSASLKPPKQRLL